jgi:hypothetical protein
MITTNLNWRKKVVLNQNEDSEVLKSTVILNSLVQSTLIELLHKNKADLFALTHQEFI